MKEALARRPMGYQESSPNQPLGDGTEGKRAKEGVLSQRMNLAGNPVSEPRVLLGRHDGKRGEKPIGTADCESPGPRDTLRKILSVRSSATSGGREDSEEGGDLKGSFDTTQRSRT